MQCIIHLQGLTLAIPEMVPFRLTQNLVDAFGVSGFEGAYRRACEVTLQVHQFTGAWCRVQALHNTCRTSCTHS